MGVPPLPQSVHKIGCGVHLPHFLKVLGGGHAGLKCAGADDEPVDEDGGGYGLVAGAGKLHIAGCQGEGKKLCHCGGLFGVCPHIH